MDQPGFGILVYSRLTGIRLSIGQKKCPTDFNGGHYRDPNGGGYLKFQGLS